MSQAKFKTMRHIETLRNYLNAVIRELLGRQEAHDQSKLQSPEVEILEEFTPKLRGITYGSQEYRDCLKAMRPMIEHHNRVNRHHPEFHGTLLICDFCGAHNEIKDVTAVDNYDEFQLCRHCQHPDLRETGNISGMNLIDLIEMLCDWKAAGLRHDDGDLMKSIEINQERFGYSDELAHIFRNTARWINNQDVYHVAGES